MAILNETKDALNEQLGSPRKANILVGGDEHFQAEEAWRYSLGRFEVTVGFRRGFSRYASFYKDPQDNPEFDDRDVEVSLALVAPASSWIICEPDSNSLGAESEPGGRDTPDSSWVIAEYRTSVTDIAGNEVGIIASHRTIRPHFLAYIPADVSPEARTPDDQTEVVDDELERLLLELNTAATAETKIDAIVAVINELAAQHRAMRERGD